MGDPTIQPTGLGANGLPVVPNVQTTSPTNTTTTPIATPEYQRTIEEQRQAYQNEGQAIQQGTDAKVLSAKNNPICTVETSIKIRSIFGNVK